MPLGHIENAHVSIKHNFPNLWGKNCQQSSPRCTLPPRGCTSFMRIPLSFPVVLHGHFSYSVGKLQKHLRDLWKEITRALLVLLLHAFVFLETLFLQAWSGRGGMEGGDCHRFLGLRLPHFEQQHCSGWNIVWLCHRPAQNWSWI